MKAISPHGRFSAVIRVLLHGIPAVLFLFGCTFNYEDASVEGTQTENVPQVALFNTRTVIQRDTRIELEAAYVATFISRDDQILEGVVFREYDQNGTLRFEGTAERAILDLETEDVELTGEIRLYGTEDDATIESDYFYWSSEARVLTAGDSPVTIVRGDGSTVVGEGLNLDGRRNLVEFTRGVRGTYVDTNE